MRRERVVYGVAALCVLGIVGFIAHSTYWDVIDVPEPPRGEAATDEHYAFKQLLRRLGNPVRELVSLHVLPSHDGVLIAPDLKDATLRSDLPALERWVEEGGRLIVSGNDVWSSAALQSWSGISPAVHFSQNDDDDADDGDATPVAPDSAAKAKAKAKAKAEEIARRLQPCQPLEERIDGRPSGVQLRACTADSRFAFASKRVPAWSLSNDDGMQMLRVAVGRGSIAVLECTCLLGNRSILEEDHARILFAAAPLRRGDPLSFLDLGASESLAALLWRQAAPAIVAAAAAVVLALWRSWPRFGPPEPAVAPVRRSLAEQLRANARFAWRTRRLAALRDTMRRALERAARRRIAAYQSLDESRRIAAIAARTGLDAHALAAALGAPAPAGGPAGGAQAERDAIELLERARRGLESESSHS